MNSVLAEYSQTLIHTDATAAESASVPTSHPESWQSLKVRPGLRLPLFSPPPPGVLLGRAGMDIYQKTQQNSDKLSVRTVEFTSKPDGKVETQSVSHSKHLEAEWSVPVLKPPLSCTSRSSFNGLLVHMLTETSSSDCC